MTNSHRFVERAVEGGYGDGWSGPSDEINTYFVLLDPEAWKAVGRATGWSKTTGSGCGKEYFDAGRYACECPNWSQDTWLHNWHRFIDALAEGKTVDESLEEILK